MRAFITRPAPGLLALILLTAPGACDAAAGAAASAPRVAVAPVARADTSRVAAAPRPAATPRVAPAPRPATTPRVAPAPPPPATPRATTAPHDTAMVLRGGQEGTVFRTLTVEGEDRIRIDVERPPLDLDLDPETAPGLEPGGPREMLDRSTPDLSLPLLATTAREPSPFLAHPWLSRFATGAVARIRPQVKGVERWRLVIADSHGNAVASYQGRGDPPAEIAWDGRTAGGATAVPGLTYSHVFEAWDRAGNKRSFVGEGFQIPAFRLEPATGPVLVFSGAEMAGSPGRTAPGTPAAIAPIVIEAGGWINHGAPPDQPLRVTVSARTLDQARALALDLARQLAAVTLGDPGRIQTSATAQPDAPPEGTIIIASAR